MRSSKLWLLSGIALAGALALYGATQIWVTVDLVPGAAAFAALESTGQQLNQSLSPVAIAALAAALALTIAGPVFRRVLGALVALLGVGILAIAIGVLGDPQGAASGRLAEVTGIAGSSSGSLVSGSETSPLIILTLIAGIALVLLGALVIIFAGKWKASGRKYETSGTSRAAEARNRAEAGDGTRREKPDRISDWEAMNDGEDPSEFRR